MTRPAPGRQTSVLLADDDPRFRQLVRTVLVEDGYDVVAEAATSDDVVTELERHRPDVVVLDLVMEEADGLRTLERVQAAHPALPVVVISSLFDPLIEQQILARGARYLEKVEGVEALEQAIDAVVSITRDR